MVVRTAFLHGEIDSGVYFVPSEGSGVEMNMGKTLKLKKVIYGFKQSPRLWYKKWNEFMASMGFNEVKSEPCMFRNAVSTAWILLHVDDLCIMSSPMNEIKELKYLLSNNLDRTDI